MSRAVRSRSTKRARKNPVAVDIVPGADEDIRAGVLAAVDADAISRLNRYVGARRRAGDGYLFVWEQRVSVKVVAAINSLNKQGFHAHLYRRGGRVWVEIDQCMLASFQEIEELVDGVHSFEELADQFRKRHAEELRRL